jgi:hypothetical protein
MVKLYQKSEKFKIYESDRKAWINQWKENFKRTPRSELTLYTPTSNSDVDKTTVVLARYNENIDWIDCFPQARFKVYNKGEVFDRGFNQNVSVSALPNLGREGGTYVEYILEHYEHLPERVLFSQADPSDHVPYYYDQIKATLDGENDIENGYAPIGKLCVCPRWMIDEPVHGIYAMYYTLFAEKWDYDHYFPWGATMLVTRDTILKRPLDFWKALKILINHRHGGPAARQAKVADVSDATWGLEKCWPVIFDGGRTKDNFSHEN